MAGAAVDVSTWRPQIPAWSPHYQVVVFDNRDVGRSSYASAPYGILDLAGDTLGLADQLELERFHLLGSSMGGAVTQEVALAAPERVLTLTLCMTYARAGRRWQEWTRHQIASSVHRTDQELVEELMLLTLSEATYEEMAEQQQMTLMRDLVLSYPHRQRRDGYVRQLQATATHDAYERLPRLAVPVHVIGAEQDLMVPVWKSRELAQLIPGARLSVVAGAAHAVHLERTREFNALVLEFLKAPGKH